MVKQSVVGALKKKKKPKPNKQQRQLKADWESLLKKHGEPPKKRSRKKFVPLNPTSLGFDKVRSLTASRSVAHLPSPAYVPVDPAVTQKPAYTGEMAEREAAARKVTHVVAPVANKMGYQLITNPDDIKTMGRKL